MFAGCVAEEEPPEELPLEVWLESWLDEEFLELHPARDMVIAAAKAAANIFFIVTPPGLFKNLPVLKGCMAIVYTGGTRIYRRKSMTAY